MAEPSQAGGTNPGRQSIQNETQAGRQKLWQQAVIQNEIYIESRPRQVQKTVDPDPEIQRTWYSSRNQQQKFAGNLQAGGAGTHPGPIPGSRMYSNGAGAGRHPLPTQVKSGGAGICDPGRWHPERRIPR